MPAHPTNAFTPSEIAAVMMEVQKDTLGQVSMSWEPSSQIDGSVHSTITVSLWATLTPSGARCNFTASQTWPTHTHKTLLGLVYSLLVAVNQQFDAAVVLAEMRSA